MDEAEQREAAATRIASAARGSRDRAEVRVQTAQRGAEREGAAVTIGAAVRGSRDRAEARARKKATKLEATAATRIASAARGNWDRTAAHRSAEDEAAAAEKIAAAARGRLERKSARKRREAASTIGRMAKGQYARRRAKKLSSKAAAIHAGAAAAAAKQAVYARATAAQPAPTSPLRPVVQIEQAPPVPLPMTYAEPPIRYKFMGLESSRATKSPRSHWQTYTTTVDGFHSKKATKLVISIEVHGPISDLASVQPLKPLSDEDWAEIANALVKADKSALTIADYTPLFLLSQSVLRRTL
ncbi:hypothetical protein T492DRAFT_1103294 [Pavlovales sp. CCMP2436]|nr:hypothetical protein T492DRAFT_1103294 [Pavlovales sp. CCMP2436]|mmetsp:Transcript_34548/g.79774  ORF Transcript_34548/g.79774 Transcript_34548/m.79774 type:complete len:300 (-) Transcript_34548:198-1097(-)